MKTSFWPTRMRSSLRVDEITTDRDLGPIPRFVGNRQSVLFWKKLLEGRIIGCVLSDSELERTVNRSDIGCIHRRAYPHTRG